ncbi:MAG: MMPL family transporter [Bacteroidota bacterium]
MHPVWQAIAGFILRGRIPILIVVGLLTAFMWLMRGTEVDQAFGKVIPETHEEFISYKNFKEEFGDDGNVLVVGIEADPFDKELFNSIYQLTDNLQTISGVQAVVSISHLFDIVRDDSLERFELERVVQQPVQSQVEMDSLAHRIRNLPFYQGIIWDTATQTTLVAITVEQKILDSKEKVRVYDEMMAFTQPFEDKWGLDLRYAGLPVLRVNIHKTIVNELILFLVLALLVMTASLWLFFRSFYTVLLPLVVVLVVIIWSMGILGLCGFKMSLITGVIPALITVIGIPNSVYLITKYHIEYRRSNNKIRALVRVIEKIGIVTVMTNATTAVGFGVLAFTDIRVLREFGVVASLSVVAAFFISLLLIPILFSFLPPPNKNQVRHLERKVLNRFIRVLDRLVHKKRAWIYVAAILSVILSITGMTYVLPVSKMVDDIPQGAVLVEDLKFVEDRFNGVMPFEIIIDGRKKRAFQRRRNLERLHELQERISEYPSISRTVSIADFAMFTRQAFFKGGAEDYLMPDKNELNFLKLYLRNTNFTANSFSKTLSDSTFQRARITGSIQDIGSIEMKYLIDSIRQDVNEVFKLEVVRTDTAEGTLAKLTSWWQQLNGKQAVIPSPDNKFDVTITGTTKLFIRGNDYLIQNLLQSLFIAFLVIAGIMGYLFRSFRMVLISLAPNFLPLLIVAGMMGFLGIALKPSTALVFSVAFGIAVDDSIHFLARYRLARSKGFSPSVAISNSFMDTGVSMIYTSVILFFGFVIFTASSFGGTQALGLLTSTTLLIAMFSNLLLLPALLLTFDNKVAPVKPSSEGDVPLEPRVLIET